jgi:hypothetical protein
MQLTLDVPSYCPCCGTHIREEYTTDQVRGYWLQTNCVNDVLGTYCSRTAADTLEVLQSCFLRSQ